MSKGLTCECSNPKQRGAEACARCQSIDADLWRLVPMPDADGKRTLTEAALAAFEGRFKGMVDWHNKTRPRRITGRGHRRGPELSIHPNRGAVRRPPSYTLPLVDGKRMSIAEAAGW